MPRNYDDYLYSSLCHSEDERTSPRASESNSRARRNSISEGLVPIPIVVEGCGVVVKMRVKPHVRWTKIISKWTAAFEKEPPMAWPILIRIPSDESSFPCKSIQESISRTLGPELLEKVSDKDPALIVVIGEIPTVTRESESDVSPPVFLDLPSVPEATVAHQDPVPAPIDPLPVPDVADAVVDVKRTYKIRIESEIFKKPVKMSVSGGCSVSRLIRKYLEALKQTDTINPDIVSVSYLGNPIEKLDDKLTDIFGDDGSDGIVMEAFVGKSSGTPKRRRRQSSAEGASTSSKARKIESEEQSHELAYWEQVRSVRKSGCISDHDNEEDDDEDLALAIALSLSTETK